MVFSSLIFIFAFLPLVIAIYYAAPGRRRHFRAKSTPLPGETLLPGAIIYRDSFMTEPLKILGGSFENLHALWTYDLLIEEGQDDLMKSPIVIQEMVERNLYFMY